MRRLLILSAFIEGKDHARNMRRHRSLGHDLSDMAARPLATGVLAWHEATGCWAGQYEQSYVVVLSPDARPSQLLSLAFRKYDQDAVLYVDRDSEASLIIDDKGERVSQYLGAWRPLHSGENLDDFDGFTVYNDTTYVVV